MIKCYSLHISHLLWQSIELNIVLFPMKCSELQIDLPLESCKSSYKPPLWAWWDKQVTSGVSQYTSQTQCQNSNPIFPVSMNKSLLTPKDLFLNIYLIAISVSSLVEASLCPLLKIVLLNTKISKQYDPGSWGLEHIQDAYTTTRTCYCFISLDHTTTLFWPSWHLGGSSRPKLVLSCF